MYLKYDENVTCSEGLSKVSPKFQQTPIGFVQINIKQKSFNLKEIPLLLNIDNYEFIFLCCTCNVENPFKHFRSIFKLNSSFYLIDDLQANKT
jgi:hypothetical protein